ncbi:GL19301 [Drosophila persimilis]|uniref:GL19301 n=1 Tax=Drosophila persimilis TaxID=7234 RepID=B4G8H9_DROPE|nr:GL19301 [Drosophila persimilis]
MGNSQNRATTGDEKSPPGGSLVRLGIAGSESSPLGLASGAMVERGRVHVFGRLMGQKRIRETFFNTKTEQGTPRASTAVGEGVSVGDRTTAAAAAAAAVEQRQLDASAEQIDFLSYLIFKGIKNF